MCTEKYQNPLFDFDTSESSILLKEGTVEISVNESTYIGNGEARLNLSPRPCIHIDVCFSSSSSHYSELAIDSFIEGKTPHKITFNNREIDVSIVNINFNGKQAIVKFRFNVEPVNMFGDESTRITRVVFHLYNFISYGMKTIWLTNDEWKVGLQPLHSTYDKIKALKAEGGYRLTHVVQIERTNSSSFSGKEAKEILDALRYLLSFARGCWCIPVCPVGFDTSKERVWELWSTPSAPWRVTKSWCDPYHIDQLDKLFPGFMERWLNKNWRQALSEAIYWYLIANSLRAIDAGIILTQSALERLAYEFFINEREPLREKEFRKHRASYKLHKLFSSLGIPLEVPTELQELHKLSIQKKWDVPRIITEIRNNIVHPERKFHAQFSSVIKETWDLGLWFLEMTILALCGYSGKYFNRFKHQWLGEVENVPWRN